MAELRLGLRMVLPLGIEQINDRLQIFQRRQTIKWQFTVGLRLLQIVQRTAQSDFGAHWVVVLVRQFKIVRIRVGLGDSHETGLGRSEEGIIQHDCAPQ